MKYVIPVKILLYINRDIHLGIFVLCYLLIVKGGVGVGTGEAKHRMLGGALDHNHMGGPGQLKGARKFECRRSLMHYDRFRTKFLTILAQDAVVFNLLISQPSRRRFILNVFLCFVFSLFFILKYFLEGAPLVPSIRPCGHIVSILHLPTNYSDKHGDLFKDVLWKRYNRSWSVYKFVRFMTQHDNETRCSLPICSMPQGI